MEVIKVMIGYDNDIHKTDFVNDEIYIVVVVSGTISLGVLCVFGGGEYYRAFGYHSPGSEIISESLPALPMGYRNHQ
jgi:hypothetical protein